jgi:hypothetical protein
MKGTTPPCEITTSPRSLFNLTEKIRHFLVIKTQKSFRRTLHRSELLVASDGVQYVASCYRERHYRQAREFRRPDTQERQRDKLVEGEKGVRMTIGPNKVAITDREHQHQLAAHSFHA